MPSSTLKPALLAAAFALAGAAPGLAIASNGYSTSASESGTSYSGGVTKNVSGNPLESIRRTTWLQGQAQIVDGLPTSFGNSAAISTVPGFIHFPASASSNSLLTQTVTNNNLVSEEVILNSIVQYGFFGMYVPSGSCANASAASCGTYFGENGRLPDLGNSGSGFDILVKSNDKSLFTLSASLGLVDGTLKPVVSKASKLLKGWTYHQVNDSAGRLQRFYSWLDTPISIDLGTLAPGESLTWTYSLTTWAFGDNPTSQGAEVAWASAGDPIGGGGVIHNNASLERPPLMSVEFRPYTPTVPEPAAWGLMLAGFGLAGAALRRRRQEASPAV